MLKKLFYVLTTLLLASCATAPIANTPTPNPPTSTLSPLPTSTAMPIPVTPTETLDPNMPPDATGQSEIGWTREVDTQTEVWVPVQLAGDAEQNIQGHWYPITGQFPLVDHELNLVKFQDSVFLSALVENGIQEGKLVHTDPQQIPDHIIGGTFTDRVLNQLYFRLFPDKDINMLMTEKIGSPERDKFVDQVNNKTLTLNEDIPTDVTSSTPTYTHFQWHPITDQLVVIRVQDKDLDTTKDPSIYSANGVKLKFVIKSVGNSNVIYAFTSLNYTPTENDIRILYARPFFVLAAYEQLPTKVTTWHYFGSKGKDMDALAGGAGPITFNGGSLPPYIAVEPQQ